MKVLLVFPQRDQRTGLYIKNAFLEVGCDLKVVDAKVEPKKMLVEAEKFQPDLLLCSRTPALSEDMITIKHKFPKIKTACWNVDARASIKHFGGALIKLFQTVDIVYTVSKGSIVEYKKICPKTNIKFLPQGIDPTLQCKESLTEEDIKKYSCDVLFVGDLISMMHKERKKLILFLQKSGINIKLYGNPGKKLINHEHNKAVMCAKINLGCSVFEYISCAISVRDYQIMGAGGFLLTNHVKDIGTLFDTQRECITYFNPQDCLNKIKYYLDNDIQRNYIAATGYVSVHERHKYSDRIKQILEDV